MPTCFNSILNEGTYCASSNFGVYVAVGIVVPVVILVASVVVSLYLRRKRNRMRIIQGQQINMTTVVPIYNTDAEQQQQAPYNYSYPPTFMSEGDGPYDKPPSYEQTIQHLNEINNTSETGAAILPISVMEAPSAVQRAQPSHNET